MTKRLTEAEFLKSVAGHNLEILHDDGVYHHIRLKKPGTRCMSFELVTYPGFLVYSGDMGCFVFERLNDMFQFFRADESYRRDYPNRTLFPNHRYWSEKLQAIDSGRMNGEGCKEFSPEKFRAAVWHDFLKWVQHHGRTFTKEQRRDLWDKIKDEVLCEEGDAHASYRAANDFRWRADGLPWYAEDSRPQFEFVDFWDHDCTVYTSRFQWACFAIQWGIQQYDASKNGGSDAGQS